MGKKKSMSDMLNDQLGFNGDDDKHNDDLFAPQLDDVSDYMAPTPHDDYDDDMPPPKRLRTESGAKRKDTKSSKRGSLPLRGALDPSLSSGSYAAVQASVDDIFGGLDGGDEDDFDLDGEEAGGYEAWAAAQEKKSKDKKKKLVALKRERERDLEAAVDVDPRLEGELGLIEKRKKHAASLEENDVLEQLSALRAKQMAVVAVQPAEDDEVDGDGDGAVGGAGATLRSDYAKQLIAAFRGVLGVRVKLQAAVARTSQLPQYYALPHFLKHEVQAKALQSETASLVRDVLADCWVGVPSTVSAQPTKQRAAFTSSTPEAIFQKLTALHKATMTEANACIAHWSSKVVTAANSAKTKTINQPLLDQIRAILSAKTRLLAKVQKNRSHARILGHPDHMHAATMKDRALRIAEGDLDDELFDDADFVRELAHRSGASAEKFEHALRAAATQSGTNGGAADGGENSRVGFHKKTKGKSVSYDPRPKLVGFMVAKPYEMGEQHEAMLASLFQ